MHLLEGKIGVQLLVFAGACELPLYLTGLLPDIGAIHKAGVDFHNGSSSTGCIQCSKVTNLCRSGVAHAGHPVTHLGQYHLQQQAGKYEKGRATRHVQWV